MGQYGLPNVLEHYWWQTGGIPQSDRISSLSTPISFPADILPGFLVFVKRPAEGSGPGTPSQGHFAKSFLRSRVVIAPPLEVNAYHPATSNAAVPFDFLVKHCDVEETVLDLWCGGGLDSNCRNLCRLQLDFYWIIV